MLTQISLNVERRYVNSENLQLIQSEQSVRSISRLVVGCNIAASWCLFYCVTSHGNCINCRVNKKNAFVSQAKQFTPLSVRLWILDTTCTVYFTNIFYFTLVLVLQTGRAFVSLLKMNLLNKAAEWFIISSYWYFWCTN